MGKRTALALIGAGLAAVSQAPAQVGITSTGGWSTTVGTADLQAGAGSDLQASYDSSSGVASISISGTVDASDNWRVDVQKLDSSWPGSAGIWVRRSSDGTGGGSVSGGSSFLQILDTSRTFFSGSGDRSNIDLQLRLDGISVQIAPGVYSTTVQYTVVDTA